MKYISTIFLCIVSLVIHAQSFTVQTGSQPYISLPNIQPISWPIGWDDEETTIPIGFPFSLGGVQHDSLLINSNGYFTTADGNYEFNPYYVDLIGVGDETAAGYLLDGTEGNRILKIEINNAGFYEDTTETARTSFQFWLYESGCWETRIGPSVIVDTFMIFEEYPGPFIGYANYVVDSVLALTGPSSAPIVLQIDSIDFPSLGDAPENGRVYTFCPDGQTTATANLATVSVDVYPNPAHDFVTVRLPRAPKDYERFSVLDIHGRTVYKMETNQRETSIQLEHLPRGVYWIQSSSKTFPGGKIVLN
jgi:hypothetical protein